MSTDNANGVDEYPRDVPKFNNKPMYFCLLVISGPFALMLIQTIISNQHFALEKRCISNVKQSSLATLQYIQDYDEHFPPSAQWMTKIAPYIKGDEAFHCPEAADRSHPLACGYAFDSRLSSAALSNIYAPATSLMIYESVDLSRNASDKCTSLPDFDHRRHSQDRLIFAIG